MATASALPERRIHSVANVNRGLAEYLGRLTSIWIEAEIAELQVRTGAYVYLTLRDIDGSASIGALMSRTLHRRLDPPPKNGDRVLANARPNLWQKRGLLRLEITELERRGLGELLAELHQRRTRLAADGLLDADRKRPLPAFPRLIGVICGRDAAAEHDFVVAATARYPRARFTIARCAVQGARAALEMRARLRALDADAEVDVIVITRGGGSDEDLLPFSDEALCRAIAACSKPVVTAVGHERDTPLCDLVADARASTPTHAARLIVPDAQAFADAAAGLADRARRVATRTLADGRRRLDSSTSRPVLVRPEAVLATHFDHAARLGAAATNSLERRLARERESLDRAMMTNLVVARVLGERSRAATTYARLSSLEPGATLQRRRLAVRELSTRGRDSAERSLRRAQGDLTRAIVTDPGGLLARALERRATALQSIERRIQAPVERDLARCRARVEAAAAALAVLGPQGTLERGYAIVLDARGVVLRAASETNADASITIRLARGSLEARVEETRP